MQCELSVDLPLLRRRYNTPTFVCSFSWLIFPHCSHTSPVHNSYASLQRQTAQSKVIFTLIRCVNIRSARKQGLKDSRAWHSLLIITHLKCSTNSQNTFHMPRRTPGIYQIDWKLALQT